MKAHLEQLELLQIQDPTCLVLEHLTLIQKMPKILTMKWQLWDSPIRPSLAIKMKPSKSKMTKLKNLRVGLSIRQQMVESTSPILLDQEKDELKPCKNSIPILMNMEEHQRHLNKRQEKLETEVVSQLGTSHKATASPKKLIPQAIQVYLIPGDNVPGLSTTEEKKSVLASESTWEMGVNG